MLIKPPTRTISDVSIEQPVVDPRSEIVEYFRLHPTAADNLDGIVEWWLPRQRYEKARALIQQALDDLVQQGVVDEFVRGKTRLYRLSRGKFCS